MSRIKQKRQGVINSLVWTQQDTNEASLSYDGTDFDFDAPVTIAGALTATGALTIGGAMDVTGITTLTGGIISTASLSIDMPVPIIGADIVTGAEVAKWIPYGKKGASGMTVTEFYIDLVGLSSTATGGDAIGDTGGTVSATLGQYTEAIFGTIVAIEMVCLELPTTGDDDIDLKSIVTADLDIDDAVAGTALITAGAAWTNGAVKGATAVPTVNHYFYLTTGGTTAGDYATGKFLIRFYGV